MGIDRRSGVGKGESGDEQKEWVGGGKSGDRQGVCSEEGTVWGVWGSGVGVDGVGREEEDWGERGQDEGGVERGRGDWETRRGEGWEGEW